MTSHPIYIQYVLGGLLGERKGTLFVGRKRHSIQMKVHEIDFCPIVLWSARPDWMLQMACLNTKPLIIKVIIKQQILYNSYG